MGALSRRKGAAYEQLITRLLRAVFGEKVKRGIGQERAGSEIADVAGVPRFWVQTKHGQYVSIRDAILQAEAELRESGKADLWPLAITRFHPKVNGHTGQELATMRLSNFVTMMAEHEYALRIIDGAAPPYGLRAQLNHAMAELRARLEAADGK